jgi:hypothetical protein
MTEASAGERPSKCPSCGATVRSDVAWCTQCYASLRPEKEGPGDVAGPTTDPAEPRRTTDPVEPRRAADPAEIERVAEQMLAELSVQQDEVRGLASRLPASPATRTLLVVGVIVVVTAVIVLLMFLIGLAL